ncbi:bifunctional 4-hydroxy-2-oxoglutarate aldolase/2-dehydro-3-deoxy-phosphogluconate aldolase [Aquicoccus sp.]|uniref:bifunctional 4-hydroxy-2-oxoglutarate aldolase/2-dehydro-3-deoxy-phosphogluconate aldolase n=1 Tax=Aquicoccus sp. TaxID=2055851 RepID=UPI0035642123
MNPQTGSAEILRLCTLAPVIPVLTIEDAAHAAPLARALVAGGLPVLEVTLRTPAAPDAILAMARVPGAVVGAGTVITPEDAITARDAGARFAVSPGATDRLLDACETVDLPLLPGAATASEAMRLSERGYHVQKFFPAEAAGGTDMLRAIGAPLPKIRFCPTGGITAQNAPEYLQLANVASVGGSWIAPVDAIAAQDWDRIERLARDAADLPRA